MSDLAVQEIAGGALAIAYVNHNPQRSATFGGAVTGTWTPGDAVAFSPSGAAGEVISYDAPSKTLTFYLLSGDPALGDAAATSGASGAAVNALAAAGDTFTNDGRTYLFVDNRSASDVRVVALAAAECSHGYLHDLAVTIGPGLSGPIGPFDRRRFNQPGGQVHVAYAGSTNPTDFGVAAVRMFPSS